MPTSDIQRMHQDEWIADLRGGQYKQYTIDLFPTAEDGSYNVGYTACAIGVCIASACLGNQEWYAAEWLGVSHRMVDVITVLNDLHGQTFDEIADWFKGERDAHNGDLSDWLPMRNFDQLSRA